VHVSFFRRPDDDSKGLQAVYEPARRRLDISVNRHEGAEEIRSYSAVEIPVEGAEELGITDLYFGVL